MLFGACEGADPTLMLISMAMYLYHDNDKLLDPVSFQ